MSSIQPRVTENQYCLVLLSCVRISYLSHNAKLRCEQRKPPYLTHCAINTKLAWSESAKRCESLLNLLLCFTTSYWLNWERTAISGQFSKPNHKVRTHLAVKGDQPKTCNSTSLPNEATRSSSNKRPVFPTKAQNSVELPRQLPSWNANWLRN